MSANLSNDPNITFKRKSFALALVILVVLPPLFIYYKNSSDTKTVNLNRPALKTWFHRFKKSDANSIDNIVQTKNGYLVLGDTSPTDHNSFVKGLDLDGKELWNRVLQSNVNFTNPQCLELDTTYLVSYRTTSFGGVSGFNLRIDKQTLRIVDRSPEVFRTIAPSTKGYIASNDRNKMFSYDKEGLLLWEKTYRHGDFFTGLISSGVRLNIPKDKIIKVLKSGSVRYKTSRGRILKVIRVEENNFFVLGFARLSGALRGSPWFFKIDSSGVVLWEETLQNPNPYPNDAVLTKDGGYLVLLNEKIKKQIHFKKYDKNGVLLWTKIYRNKRSGAWHMAQTGDGKYMVTGATAATMWLLKIDQDAQLLWQKKRRSEIGDYPSTIISTLDGGVLIGGHAAKEGDRVEMISRGRVISKFIYLEEGAWLLKLDADGEGSDENFKLETAQEWKEI